MVLPPAGRYTVALMLVVGIIFAGPFIEGALASEKAAVLLFNAYHKGLAWTDSVTSGVESILKGHDIYVEYMDTKRHTDERYLDLLRGLMVKKYQLMRFDVIISSDDYALSFLLEHRDTLFPGVPIVFCGVNDYSESMLAGHDQITGVVEAFDIRQTIGMALRLHPSAGKMVIVNDTTKTGVANKRVIERLLPEFAGQVQFEFLEALTMPDLLASIRALPSQSLVLLMSFNRDAAGRVYDYDTSIQLIAQACPVPIYGIWDFYLGKGIIGGKLTSGRAQGETAAAIALRVIGGERADRIPVVTQSPNRWMFDHRQLLRFNVNASSLPADRVIINQPASIYRQYKAIIWSALIAVFSLATLSIFLLATIEKRRRVEKRLRESQQLMVGIADNVPGVVYQFYAKADGQVGFNFVSQKAFEFFELTASPETFFKAFSERVHDDDQARFFSSITEAVATVRAWHFEGRFIKPSGAAIWFAGNAVPHRNGETVVFDGVLTDITERRAAEKEVKELHAATQKNLAFIQAMLSAIPTPVFFKDTEGRYLGCNQAFSELMGVAADQIKGKTVHDVWPGEKAKRYHQKDLDLIRSPGRQVSEFTVSDKHGRELDVIFAKDTFCDDKGDVAGIVGAFVDITDRKAAQEEIRQRQLFLESVLYHAPDAIVTLDAQHRVVDWNPGAEKIFGYTREEALGQALDDLVSGDEARVEALQKTRKVMSGERIEAFETVRYRKDGARVNVVAAGSPIMVDGTLTGVVAMYTDVTALKQAQDDVRRNERMLRRIMDIVPSMIFVKNAQGRFLMANQAVADSYGMTVEALQDKLQEEVHPDPGQVAQMLAGDRQVIESGQRLSVVEEPYQDSTGATRWLEVIKVPGDANDFGEPVVVGLATDITERRAVEARIQESEKRYRTMFENTGTGTVLSEADTILSMVNSEFTRLVGYSREEIEGKMSWTQLVAPEDVERMKQYHQARRQPSGSAPTEWECSVVDKLGQVKRVLLKVRLIPGTQTSIGSFLDITERKQAEEELRRLRNYLSNIINSMPSVLVGVDTHGRVTQWNKQAERTTGITFDKARSQPLTAVFPQLIDVMERIKSAIQDRRVLRDPKIPRHSNGETRFEDITIFPLVANGVEGAVIRVDDVTERVRLEEMMIQSEKMLSVGGLAAGMAHEINNPLAGILQNTAVLENRLFGDLPANRKAAEAAGTTMAAIQHFLELRKLPSMIEHIRTSGNRAAAIVRNMLSFARKSDRIISSHDLGSLLDQTIELAQTDYDMKKHYDFKQIRLFREYDRTVAPVPCEASKLQQVFLNILKNGAEAMAEMQGGAAHPAFFLRVKDDGLWVRVEIEDSGPGMDEQTRRRIFEPFFTTKPVGKGTGLGLSVSYFIITENHGGKMNVHAAAHGGTRFVIRLPKTGKS